MNLLIMAGRRALLLWFAVCSFVALDGIVRPGMAQPFASKGSTIQLPFSANRVFPVNAKWFLAMDTNLGAAVLIDATSGTIIARFEPESPAAVQSYVATANIEGDADVQILLKSRAELSDGAVLLRRLRIRGSTFEAQPPMPLGEPVRDGLIYAMSGRRDREELLLWDRARPQGGRLSVVASDGAVQRTMFLRSSAHEFAGIGKSDVLLAVHPRENAVSLFNTKEGIVEDRISVEYLSFDDPGQMAVFVPAAPFGGTGDVLIANSFSEYLTVLSIPGEAKLARISAPSRISLKTLRAIRGGYRNMLLAASGDLSVILVSAIGSTQIGVFTKIGAGLQEINNISIDMPLRDMTIVQGRGGGAQEIFVFLDRSGREVRLEHAIGRLGYDQTPAAQLGTDLQGTANIARVQRLLATLGYQVGAIDGLGGARTKAAVRSFQIEKGLEVTGNIDERTLVALSSLANEGTQKNRPDPSYLEQYASTLGDLQMLYARKLLTLGASNEDPNHRCFSLNELPPRDYWRNSLPMMQILKRLENDFGLAVEIVSAYRTPSYNRCVSGAEDAPYLQFRGFDLRSASAKEDGARLLRAIERLRDEKAFAGTVEPIGSQTVHVHLWRAGNDPSPGAEPSAATVTFTVCRGEYESRCQPHDVYLYCYADVHGWAKSKCSSHTLLRLNTYGGNKCGYAIDAVYCTGPR